MFFVWKKKNTEIQVIVAFFGITPNYEKYIWRAVAH